MTIERFTTCFPPIEQGVRFILKSDIDGDGSCLEELCMRLRDPSCESIFLGGGERRVVGDDVEWHFDGQLRRQTRSEDREEKAGERKAERRVLEVFLNGETRRDEVRSGF
jgi:hypothetical protein